MWGAIEFGNWICPLTPLENTLREYGGGAAYQGDFIERYLTPVLYPANLTRTTQFVVGGLALSTNVVVYAMVIRRYYQPHVTVRSG